MQEAMQHHFQGLRERDAGWDIDREMTDEGFYNRIGVDLTIRREADDIEYFADTAQIHEKDYFQI